MSTEIKRLYRSRSDRMIGGVCSGLGKYLDVDPTLVRLLFVFVAVLGALGPGILTYLVLMIVVPEEPFEAATTSVVQSTVEVSSEE